MNGTKASVKAEKKVAKNLIPKPFPIVGFGASAGGIEAFTKLLRHLDDNLGMAYVLIMHLSPNHKSALKEIMQAKTNMRVQTVVDGMEVMANNVYVMPPNTFMSIVDGHLKLAPRTATDIGNFAVDYFLTTLAAVYKNNAIGVILSGMASDGTLGLKAIKAEGGITFAQDETAEFSGMPGNASDSGYVDFRLSPEEIAQELARLVKTPYTSLPPEKIEAQQLNEINKHKEELRKILSVVKNKSGIDFFNNYKHASIYRRVVRRMVLNKFDNIEDYCAMLKATPREVDSLYDDFLINVTSFFRDPHFYETLKKIVFPSIIQHKKASDPIRIWVAGCATGEEAYSVAITLAEFLEEKGISVPIQIFASDLDANAIERARLGIYTISVMQGLSKSLLKKYFSKIKDHYQIVKSVREICVFSQQNLLKDPPFSRIDLISCQNVLIYLEANPQKKILQTFHYALKPKGHLFLGKSETIGSSSELFEPLDKKIKLYSRKPSSTPQLDFTIQTHENVSAKEHRRMEKNNDADVEKAMGKMLLSRFVYPSVVVNKNFMIVQFFGVTSPYLEPLTGKASFNVLKMIREDLVIDLGSLLQEARKTEKPTIKEGIRVYNKKLLQEITIEIVPIKAAEDIFFLVVFKESTVILQQKSNAKPGTPDQKEKTINKLEEELTQSRALIRNTNEEYETTYEELQANNEEMLSSNEELQSVNEELESSKEELQSANEELIASNTELAKRNAELSDSQRELKKINEQLEQFAYISSHDLQEPLRKISIFSDLLLNEESNLNEYAKKYAEKINTSAKRMSTLLKGLLPFTQLNKNDLNNRVDVDFNEIVKNVIEDFEIVVENKKAIINYSKLPVLMADLVQINQLFHNLMANALKFCAANPVINISSKAATAEDYINYPELIKGTHYVSVSVADNGIGFNEKYVPVMFNLFQRLDNSRDVEGTGVGLTICKKIIDNHNGFIFAKGVENVGATFIMFFPDGNTISLN